MPDVPSTETHERLDSPSIIGEKAHSVKNLNGPCQPQQCPVVFLDGPVPPLYEGFAGVGGFVHLFNDLIEQKRVTFCARSKSKSWYSISLEFNVSNKLN